MAQRRRRRRQRLGDLTPDQNSRIAEALADRSFDTASEAIRLVRGGHCGEVVSKINEAAALYGKASGHYANRPPDNAVEEILDRAWGAVKASASKFRHQCLRPLARRRTLRRK